MLSIISNAFLPILFTGVGIWMLFAPYETAQKAFPKLHSKKALKIVGAVLLLCGVGSIILLGMDFLDFLNM